MFVLSNRRDLRPASAILHRVRQPHPPQYAQRVLRSSLGATTPWVAVDSSLSISNSKALYSRYPTSVKQPMAAMPLPTTNDAFVATLVGVMVFRHVLDHYKALVAQSRRLTAAGMAASVRESVGVGPLAFRHEATDAFWNLLVAHEPRSILDSYIETALEIVQRILKGYQDLPALPSVFHDGAK